METLALLRPHDPLTLARFRRFGSPQARAHLGTSPSSQVVSLAFPVFCLGTQLPKLSCVLRSWKNHHIARGKTVTKSRIVTTMGSLEFSTHPLIESQVGSRIRGACFYAVTAVSAIFLFMAMVVVHPFVLLFDRYRRRAHHLVAKVWASLTMSPFCRMEFEGLENLPPDDAAAVYVSNHQSFLDIYTLLTLGKSFKFISKRGVLLFPIIGWAMFLMGIIPLRRVDTRSQLDCLKRCIALVKKGTSVYFFPEGTRSKDGKLCAFKKGAFSVAVKTGAPIVPITLLGMGRLMPPGMEGSLNAGSVKVVIHEPIQGNDADILCSSAWKDRMEIESVPCNEGQREDRIEAKEKKRACLSWS
ncbi:hypothetical protein Taro_023143 [Colocasia esculenta]|uniref:Phospholipid/glycerol acyltransferase domain-containing protein n=1 Tax=Colocasia esculenta TaxID=4460 RepID=A0A843V5L6_COLES|nr:hypothetical protein [Colocasia esculenta]